MLARTLTRRLVSVGRRQMSAAVESPHQTIAKNILRIQHISEADSEAAMNAAANDAIADVNLTNLPEELKEYKAFFGVPGLAGGEPYVPDPEAWQNKPFWEFAQEEVQRTETWPLFVGAVLVNLLFFGFQAALPKKGSDVHDNSRYVQLLENPQHAAEVNVAKEAAH